MKTTPLFRELRVLDIYSSAQHEKNIYATTRPNDKWRHNRRCMIQSVVVAWLNNARFCLNQIMHNFCKAWFELPLGTLLKLGTFVRIWSTSSQLALYLILSNVISWFNNSSQGVNSYSLMLTELDLLWSTFIQIVSNLNLLFYHCVWSGIVGWPGCRSNAKWRMGKCSQRFAANRSKWFVSCWSPTQHSVLQCSPQARGVFCSVERI